MLACATEKGICLLKFKEDKYLNQSLENLKKKLNVDFSSDENLHLKQLKTELVEYFEGKRFKFETRLDLQGTEFQKQVWKALIEIPYGSIYSYQKQAEKMNQALAIRAIATANARNLIGIIIPCHRVLGKNGKLTGYSGGIEKKRSLLLLEQKFNPIVQNKIPTLF